MIQIAVVVAVYNEEDNVKPLVEKIHEALSGFTYEIILVNDGSTDKTVKKILELDDDMVKLVDLRKNYGQSSALGAGLDVAEAEWIITMDGDLQNDPLDIPAMIKKAEEEELDVVAGIRAKRKDGMIFRKIPSKIANWMIRKSTGLHIKDLGCALKVFRYDIAKDIRLYGELHRFIAILAYFEGGRVGQMDVRHHARIHGKSKYGMGRTFKVLSDLIMMLFIKRYLQKPIHLFGKWGLFLLVPGIGINIWMVIKKLMGEDIWGKPMLLLGIMLVLGGIQLIAVGIITEMQMRTYYESQAKRPYKIRKIVRGKDKKEEVPV